MGDLSRALKTQVLTFAFGEEASICRDLSGGSDFAEDAWPVAMGFVGAGQDTRNSLWGSMRFPGAAQKRWSEVPTPASERSFAARRGSAEVWNSRLRLQAWNCAIPCNQGWPDQSSKPAQRLLLKGASEGAFRPCTLPWTNLEP